MEERANLLAQSILESRDAVPVAGWRENGRAAGMGWQVSASPYETAVARNAPAVPRLHEVRVVVEWESRRGPRRLELHTLLPQQRPLPGDRR